MLTAMHDFFSNQHPQNFHQSSSLTSLLHSEMASTDTSNPTTSTTASPTTDTMWSHTDEHGSSQSSYGLRRPFRNLSSLFKKTIGRRRTGPSSEASVNPSPVISQSPVNNDSPTLILQAIPANASDSTSRPAANLLPQSPAPKDGLTRRAEQTSVSANLSGAPVQVSAQAALASSTEANTSSDHTVPAASSPSSSWSTGGQRDHSRDVGRFRRFFKRKLRAMGLQREVPATENVDPAYEAYRSQWDAEFSGKLNALRESAANSAHAHSEAVAQNEQLTQKVANLQRALCWERALQMKDLDEQVSDFPLINHDGSISDWQRSNIVAKFHAGREERNDLVAKLADAQEKLAALQGQQCGATMPVEDVQSRLDALKQLSEAARLESQRVDQELEDAKIALFGAEAEKKALQVSLSAANQKANEFEELSNELRRSNDDSTDLIVRRTTQYSEAMQRLTSAASDIEQARAARLENESLRTAVSILFRQMERLNGITDPTSSAEVAHWARALPRHEAAPGEPMVPLSAYRAAISSFMPVCDLATALRDELAAQFVGTLGPNERATATERVLGPAGVLRALQIARYAARTFRDGHRAELERAVGYRRLLEEHGLA